MRGSLVSLYPTDIKEASYAFSHEVSSPHGLQGTAMGMECMHGAWNNKPRAHILSLKQEKAMKLRRAPVLQLPKLNPIDTLLQ